MDYTAKYLKYKNKYLNLKNSRGGGQNVTTNPTIDTIINNIDMKEPDTKINLYFTSKVNGKTYVFGYILYDKLKKSNENITDKELCNKVFKQPYDYMIRDLFVPEAYRTNFVSTITPIEYTEEHIKKTKMTPDQKIFKPTITFIDADNKYYGMQVEKYTRTDQYNPFLKTSEKLIFYFAEYNKTPCSLIFFTKEEHVKKFLTKIGKINII
jgi:hypothetical protein